MSKPIPQLSINVDQDAAWGNLTSTSSITSSQGQEFTRTERFGPTTLSSPGYEKFSFPDQTFYATARTPTKPESRIILCRNYTRRGRCSFGASCKFFHDPALLIASNQRKKVRDRVSNCNDCPQGMHRLSVNPQPEDPSHYLKYKPRRPENAFSGGAFWPQAIDHSETSYPLDLQPDFCYPQTLSVTDTLALNPDGVGEEQCSVMDNFSVTKIPLHFQCHGVRVGPHAEGVWSDPFTARLPSIAQSRSTGQFDTPNSTHVQNRTESSMPSSTSQPSIVPSRSRSQSLKDLVDELPVYPFVHSPLKNIRREEMRSVTYEDLLTGAREESPLRRQKSVACF